MTQICFDDKVVVGAPGEYVYTTVYVELFLSCATRRVLRTTGELQSLELNYKPCGTLDSTSCTQRRVTTRGVSRKYLPSSVTETRRFAPTRVFELLIACRRTTTDGTEVLRDRLTYRFLTLLRYPTFFPFHNFRNNVSVFLWFKIQCVDSITEHCE